MTSGVLWMPPTPDRLPDPDNLFNMLHARQRVILAIADPDERDYEIEKICAAMAAKELNLEHLSDVTVGSDLTLVPSLGTINNPDGLLEREIGLRGDIKGFGTVDLAHRVLGLTINMDATHVFDRNNPSETGMLLRPAYVPISYVKYIEFSSPA